MPIAPTQPLTQSEIILSNPDKPDPMATLSFKLSLIQDKKLHTKLYMAIPSKLVVGTRQCKLPSESNLLTSIRILRKTTQPRPTREKKQNQFEHNYSQFSAVFTRWCIYFRDEQIQVNQLDRWLWPFTAIAGTNQEHQGECSKYLTKSHLLMTSHIHHLVYKITESIA